MARSRRHDEVGLELGQEGQNQVRNDIEGFIAGPADAFSSNQQHLSPAVKPTTSVSQFALITGTPTSVHPSAAIVPTATDRT